MAKKKKDKKSTDPSFVEQFFNQIQKRIFGLKKELENLDGEKITIDPSMMAKGPSPMFGNKEEAEKTMEEPDIIFVRQHIKNLIAKTLRKSL